MKIAVKLINHAIFWCHMLWELYTEVSYAFTSNLNTQPNSLFDTITKWQLLCHSIFSARSPADASDELRSITAQPVGVHTYAEVVPHAIANLGPLGDQLKPKALFK